MARRTLLEVGAPGALADYYDWFKEARNGDVLVYHRGDLANDRDASMLPREPGFDHEREKADLIDKIAERVAKDRAEGYLVLVQKRLGEEDYEYWAVRRLTPLEALFSRPKVKDAGLVQV